MDQKKKTIARDLSWLNFNARVLQEAADPTVPLRERVRFLGIFSNNMDEFFRVRVATLKRMAVLRRQNKKQLANEAVNVLEQIQEVVLEQNQLFDRCWLQVQQEMKREKIFLLNERQLNKEQQQFVAQYFDDEVESSVNPLMIESIAQFPYLRDKSVYLGVVMRDSKKKLKNKYALIEVPRGANERFVRLPSKTGEHAIMLLEDVIRYNLKNIFSFLGYDQFQAHLFKLTKDAEIDIDNDISTSLIQKIERGLKNRRRGKTVRFVYDKAMDMGLLNYLLLRLNLHTKKDNIIPGGRIHNFRHFMDFPDVFKSKSQRRKPFLHPLFREANRVTDVVLKRDVLLNFPYHSYNAVIDLLREAAMDDDVKAIKVTAYRLASNSKVINALINAARNGKQVVVVLELRARFEEEANLEWKERLELEGVKVLIGIPNMKVHAKICLIKKRVNKTTVHYGFVSTGNLNEKTSKLYGDHCLLTANRNIMADVNRIFDFLENPSHHSKRLKNCRQLLVCPNGMRNSIGSMIRREIKNAKLNKPASIIVKLNSISDWPLIEQLYEAASAGVQISLIVRGIFCAVPDQKKFRNHIQAISIVDEYLEHARVMIFHNNGAAQIYLSSADWMVRNLDHRIEAAVPIFDEQIKQELQSIIQIQLNDNVKARVHDNEQSNQYVRNKGKKQRSQVQIYEYLQKQQYQLPAGK
jgi:polyphosphate kinase